MKTNGSKLVERRHTVMAAGLFAALLSVGAMIYGHMAEARAAAVTAMSDAKACEELASEIRSLRERPSLAKSQELAHQELTQRIEAAAQSAGIGVQSLIRITPEPARRVTQTAYERKPTQVVLRDVKLPQLVAFLEQIGAEDAGPQVTRLRLDAPAEQDGGDQWGAELTLTYLIYSPEANRTRSPGTEH
ncbi:MAG: hypothetical protein GC162_07050 [Planctomycetes bacterium]|nr:hypothetical protein [Planctomycetota bacterium]